MQLTILPFVVTALFLGSSSFAHPTPEGTLDARLAGPTTKQAVGTWKYKGCYKDFGPRILTSRFDVPGGNSAERCTALCESKGYGLAGMEYGQECWCDNYMPYGEGTVLQMPESDCNMVCAGDSTEICGAGNRVTLYENSAGTPVSPSSCISWRDSLDMGYLRAVAKDKSIPPALIFGIPTAPPTDYIYYSVLATCPSPCDFQDFHYFSAYNNGLAIFNDGSLAPRVGESQLFYHNLLGSSPAYTGYCFKPNPTSASPFIGNPILAVNGIEDKWALCTNTTTSANNRKDIIFSPVANHAHYSLGSCVPINIETYNNFDINF